MEDSPFRPFLVAAPLQEDSVPASRGVLTTGGTSEQKAARAGGAAVGDPPAYICPHRSRATHVPKATAAHQWAGGGQSSHVGSNR